MASDTMARIVREKLTPERLTAFRVGDNVSVHVKIKEGDKERVQVFTGTVIGRKGRGSSETFTVRRISHGVGVERIFPVHSPYLAQIEVHGSTHVRRAKLYYVRKLTGKQSRRKAQASRA